MGIDLGDIMRRTPTSVDRVAGQTVAVDAWNVLYQFLSAIRQPDGTPLKDQQGRITSHLAGILYRTGNLVDAGVKTVWVFDGPPHPLKRETLQARRVRRDAATQEYEDALEAGDMETARSKAQQTSRMTPEMAEQAQALLRGLGIPVVQAPSEGEAQAAWLAREGKVDAVASQDFDALLFGAPRVLRNLTVSGRRKLPGKQVWVDVAPEEILLAPSLAASELSQEELIDIALLVGTDFHPGIKGIGAKKALQLVKKNGGLEPLLERLAANPESADSAVERALLEQHEALAERETIRQLFADAPHEDVDLSPPEADHDAVRRLMIREHGFAQERVDGALKRFQAAAERKRQQTLFDF